MSLLEKYAGKTQGSISCNVMQLRYWEELQNHLKSAGIAISFIHEPYRYIKPKRFYKHC